jgi:hypothetical protein
MLYSLALLLLPSISVPILTSFRSMLASCRTNVPDFPRVCLVSRKHCFRRCQEVGMEAWRRQLKKVSGTNATPLSFFWRCPLFARSRSSKTVRPTVLKTTSSLPSPCAPSRPLARAYSIQGGHISIKRLRFVGRVGRDEEKRNLSALCPFSGFCCPMNPVSN